MHLRDLAILSARFACGYFSDPRDHGLAQIWHNVMTPRGSSAVHASNARTRQGKGGSNSGYRAAGNIRVIWQAPSILLPSSGFFNGFLRLVVAEIFDQHFDHVAHRLFAFVPEAGVLEGAADVRHELTRVGDALFAAVWSAMAHPLFVQSEHTRMHARSMETPPSARYPSLHTCFQ